MRLQNTIKIGKAVLLANIFNKKNPVNVINYMFSLRSSVISDWGKLIFRKK